MTGADLAGDVEVAIVVCCAPHTRGRPHRKILARVVTSAGAPVPTVRVEPGVRFRPNGSQVSIECDRHGWATVDVDDLGAPSPARKGPAEVQVHRSLP